jgi:hypothetical protein
VWGDPDSEDALYEPAAFRTEEFDDSKVPLLSNATVGWCRLTPSKPVLKASGPKRSKLKYDRLLSTFAFDFNLRRYATALAAHLELHDFVAVLLFDRRAKACMAAGAHTRPVFGSTYALSVRLGVLRGF